MTQNEQKTEEFVRLITHYQPRIYLFILSLVFNHGDAEEVMQETSLVLWRKFDDFQPGSDFRAWAFEVAYRNVQAFIGRRKRDRLRFDQEFLNTVWQTSLRLADDLDIRQQALGDCLGQLSEKDKNLIQARYQPEATVNTMAQDVGRSTDAIYKAMSRIRKTLHDCIQHKMAAENT